MVNKIFNKAESGDDRAIFLTDIIKNFSKKTPRRPKTATTTDDGDSGYCGHFNRADILYPNRSFRKCLDLFKRNTVHFLRRFVTMDEP